MNIRFALSLFGLFLMVQTSFAQYASEALRFSQFQPTGTARFQGLGGVNTALGADLSSLAGNPAGLGVYQKSEIGISTAFGFASTNSNYLNKNTKDQRDYFNFPNLGIVFTNRKDESETGAFRGGSFGIGLTRIANFQNQFSYSGLNSSNSIADFFVEQTNGLDAFDDLEEEYDNIETLQGLAYWTYITNDEYSHNGGSGSRIKYLHYKGDNPANQEGTFLTKGAINQWNFSYGGNFNDNLYVGASVGIPIIRSITSRTHKEKMDAGPVEHYKFSENIRVRGSGINLKLGMVAKPQDWIRVGLSVQTPTVYSINEEYSYAAESKYIGDMVPTKGKTTPTVNKYNLTSPFRASAGLALFAGKSGFIAADIEYVGYNRMRLNEASIYATPDNSTFEEDNEVIKNNYKSAVNLSLGGELRKDIYRFRGGVALQGDAYNNVDDVNRKVLNLSLGAGVRLDEYYFDVALVNSRYNSIYQPYFLNDGSQPTAQIKNITTNFVLSAGIFF